MGIFDKLRRNKRITDNRSERLDNELERILEEHRREIFAAYADAANIRKRQPKLSEHDAMLLEATSIGLIPVRVHLTRFLEDYNKAIAEAQLLATSKNGTV